MSKSKTKHLVALDTLPALDLVPEHDFSLEKLPGLRKQIDQAIPDTLKNATAATRDTVKVSRRSIAGPEGAPDIDILIYEPVNLVGTCGAILDIHGGVTLPVPLQLMKVLTVE